MSMKTGNVVALTSELTLPRKKIVDLIATLGSETTYHGGSRGTTFLIQGSMGHGKTQIVHDLGKRFPKHNVIILDVVNMDLGDTQMPAIIYPADGGHPYSIFAPNEMFGIHLQQPCIILMDEYLKGKRAVKASLCMVAMERELAGKKLHPKTIIFAAANRDGEGLGDQLLEHEKQRFLPVRMRNQTKEEVIEHGANKGWHPALLGFMAEKGDLLFQDFDEISDYRDNPYPFHPQAVGREAFFSPRGAEECSKFVYAYDEGLVDKASLRVLIAARVNETSMRDLMTYIDMAADMPTIDMIKEDPNGCLVPSNVSAQFMLATNTLAIIERNWVDKWMDYLDRLTPNVQDVFVLCVKPDTYKKREFFVNNTKFQKWCHTHNYLFT